MTGVEYLQHIRKLARAADDETALHTCWEELCDALRVVTKEEQPPAPESEFAEWLAFRSKYAAALVDSHVCGHYYELSEPALAKLADVYEQIVAYVANTAVDASQLQSFVEQLSESASVIRSQPITSPSWKKLPLPEVRPYRLQLMFDMGVTQPTRAAYVPIEDVEIQRRHGGTQLNFTTTSAERRILASSLVATFWVFAHDRDPSQNQVTFGTAYIGSQFPFEDGSLLANVMNSQTPNDELLREIKRFLQTIETEGLVVALLPPVAMA